MQIVTCRQLAVNPAMRHAKPPRPDIPMTPASVAAARADCERERADVQRLTGLLFDADGTARLPLPQPVTDTLLEAQGMPMEARVACCGELETLVERYGLRQLLRCVKAVAAARHVEVECKDSDRVAQLLEGDRP